MPARQRFAQPNGAESVRFITAWPPGRSVRATSVKNSSGREFWRHARAGERVDDHGVRAAGRQRGDAGAAVHRPHLDAGVARAAAASRAQRPSAPRPAPAPPEPCGDAGQRRTAGRVSPPPPTWMTRRFSVSGRARIVSSSTSAIRWTYSNSSRSGSVGSTQDCSVLPCITMNARRSSGAGTTRFMSSQPTCRPLHPDASEGPCSTARVTARRSCPASADRDRSWSRRDQQPTARAHRRSHSWRARSGATALPTPAEPAAAVPAPAVSGGLPGSAVPGPAADPRPAAHPGPAVRRAALPGPAARARPALRRPAATAVPRPALRRPAALPRSAAVRLRRVLRRRPTVRPGNHRASPRGRAR